MDIQTRKLEFIQDFLKIQNEEVISVLESILEYSKDEFSPMTIEEFNSKIDQSLEDEKNGRTISAQDLRKKVEKWS